MIWQIPNTEKERAHFYQEKLSDFLSCNVTAIFASMGIKGAAIATFVSQLLNLLFIFIGFVICVKMDGDQPILSLRCMLRSRLEI